MLQAEAESELGMSKRVQDVFDAKQLRCPVHWGRIQTRFIVRWAAWFSMNELHLQQASESRQLLNTQTNQSGKCIACTCGYLVLPESSLYNLDLPYDREEKMQCAKNPSQKKGEHLFALKWNVCVCVFLLAMLLSLCVLQMGFSLCVALHGSPVMGWLFNLSIRSGGLGGTGESSCTYA